MGDDWVPLVFGWPAIGLSVLLVVLGLVLRKSWLVVVGVVVSLPFNYYLSGAPGARNASWILPILLLAAAYALHRGRHRVVATALVVPYVAVVAWLAYVVLSQPRIW